MRQETEKMVEIAKEAGKIAMKYFNVLKEHHISTKDDGSILTIADTEVDAYIRKELEDAFPDHSVLSEESENTKTTEGVFIIDPIDATRNFSAGNPYFAISLGFMVNNIPEIGVVYAPAKNELYIGEENGDAFLNGEKIHISDNQDLSNTKILLDLGLNPITIEAHAKIAELFKEQNISLDQKSNCAALDLCSVAKGEVDAFVHKRARGWDIGAGMVILKSAGGVMCQLDGNNKDLFVPGIIATNPKLKDKIVAITKDC